jgi:uncharacterized protein (TIGR03066 family)
MLRCFAALIAVAAVAAPLVADDKKDEKIDPAKLVGKWKLTKAAKDLPKGASAVVEFTKDGKLVVAMAFEKQEAKFDGTYKLSGAKVDTVMKTPDGQEKKETMEIVKLTDAVLHTKDEKGEVDEFERVKDEKKDK